jgi:hypothetical protein
MDTSLDKFKEDVRKFEDATMRKHLWCGEVSALSRLIAEITEVSDLSKLKDELRDRQDNALVQANYWRDRAVKYHAEIEWE